MRYISKISGMSIGCEYKIRGPNNSARDLSTKLNRDYIIASGKGQTASPPSLDHALRTCIFKVTRRISE